LGSDDPEQLLSTISKISVKRCFQPTVIAAYSLPCFRHTIRYNFLVDIDKLNGAAQLQRLYDGLYEASRGAVPINMIILERKLGTSYMI
jgi:hypothetical protein